MPAPLPIHDARRALSELSAPELEAWALESGLPGYRGRQIYAALLTQWFGIDDAIRAATYKTEKEIMKKAQALVAAGGRGPATE